MFQAKAITETIARKALPRFRTYARVTDDSSCHEWTGPVSPKGYGRLVLTHESEFRAHRIAYYLFHGFIDATLEIDHLCRNTSCVNALHMEQVTTAENLRRGHEYRRMVKEADAIAAANVEDVRAEFSRVEKELELQAA